MKNYIKILIVFLLVSFSSVPTKKSNDIFGEVEFASKEQAILLLSKEDAYTKRLSKFDIDAKLQKAGGTKKELVDLTASQSLDWSKEEINNVKEALENIKKSIVENHFKIAFPKITFIKSTVESEGGAAGYTRGSLIVLKDDLLSGNKHVLEKLVAHELFHVLTRNNPKLRKQLYSIIDFTVIDEVTLPSSIKEHIISNPDAPFTDSYITLKIEGEDKDCLMFIYANRPYTTGSFFGYINIGFVELEGDDSKKEVVLSDGKPIIYNLKQASNFFEKVGRNTNYIINPEEILAENFVHAIIGKEGLPNQEIVDELIKVLQQK